MPPTANQQAQAIKIGASFMFSGAIAELGQDSFDGADVALRLIKDRGGRGLMGRALEWVKSMVSAPRKPRVRPNA